MVMLVMPVPVPMSMPMPMSMPAVGRRAVLRMIVLRAHGSTCADKRCTNAAVQQQSLVNSSGINQPYQLYHADSFPIITFFYFDTT